LKFGPVAIGDAEGAILAHSTSVGDRRLRKSTRLTHEDIHALRQAGVQRVVVANLEDDDVGEDEAAQRLAEAMHLKGIEARAPATGRVNLHAAVSGVFSVDAELVNAINAVDPAVTVATLADMSAVAVGQMVATIKIIPYAIHRAVLQHALETAAIRQLGAVHAYRPASVFVVQTTMPSLKSSVMDKTLQVTRERLARSGSSVDGETRVPHEVAAVAAAASQGAASCDMVLIFGASAVSDFEDVIPAAIRQAGGHVTRTGMPVDPGNLLVLGEIAGKTVIGAPGCARSPKENGFDWVLDRILAGLEITDRDIAGMGVGGLLMEIASRPQPRERSETRDVRTNVDAVILAAGRSARMGGPNKLMAEFDGKALVRHLAERAFASSADNIVVVTGHEAARICQALDGLPFTQAHNDAFASGLASSLKVGVAAVQPGSVGALVMLADMPGVSTDDLDRMLGEFRSRGGSAIVRATHSGKRGNPVILPRKLFAAVASLEGDTGARHLVEGHDLEVIDVEIGSAASLDVDTPQAMESAGGILKG